MAFPSDIKLPADAKYIGFIDYKKKYNPNYDIVWSFQYAISGNAGEAGFCTFLTSNPLSSMTSAIPGHYLGYSGSIPMSAYIVTESGDFILTEDYQKLILEGAGGIEMPNGVCIAFDSTGLFALSSSTRSGVPLSKIKKNSLIVRDSNDNIVLYGELSSLSPDFSILSSSKSYKIIRCKYTDTDKLSIDYKYPSETEFKTLTSIRLNIIPENFRCMSVGFSYSSPVSSLLQPSTLFLKNFHIQGSESSTLTETLSFNRF